MKLFGVTTTYNVERLVPYVMKYVKNLDMINLLSMITKALIIQ